MHNPIRMGLDRNLCITQEEYDSIFDHGLNEDCTTKSLKFSTYNALLLEESQVAYHAAAGVAADRADELLSMIAALDTDVLCLNEVM